MTISSETKPPLWFWILAILALLWNLMGVIAYLSEAYMSDAAFAELPETHQNLYEVRPPWVTAAFAIAVFAGTLGSIGLLMRKGWALPVFVVSLIGVIGQTAYQFFLSDTFQVLGNQYMIMPLLVLIIAIALIFFTRSSKQKNWFH